MKRQLPPGAREAASLTRQQRGVFNKYLKRLGGGHANKRLEQVEAQIARGTRTKKVPVFEDGVRSGSVEKECPLLPSDRADLLAKKRALETRAGERTDDSLRVEFLAMLPEYVGHKGLSRIELLAVGVPEEDLDDAGI